MPAHKLFQRPVITTHLSHEASKAFDLGVPGDPMTFQTNFIATLDHAADSRSAPSACMRILNGKPVYQQPLDLFMGKAVCLVPDVISPDPATSPRSTKEKRESWTSSYIALLSGTGFHKTQGPVYARLGVELQSHGGDAMDVWIGLADAWSGGAVD